MAAYSFLDVQANIVGPGGAVPIGAGSGNAEEGISIEFVDDKGSMTVGADGSVAHSLHASKAAKVRVRLLKTSLYNALLTALYTFQTSSSLYYGQNVLVIANIATGDVYTGREVGFARGPANQYAKDVNIIEWEFNAGQMDFVLGGR